MLGRGAVSGVTGRGSADHGTGVLGTIESAHGTGVRGHSAKWVGVSGDGKVTGLTGTSANGTGVRGASTTATGVVGRRSPTYRPSWPA